MKTVGVLFLGLLALTASQGCRHKDPEPIPGPKAGGSAGVHFRPSGIAWFQGNFEEAFAPPPHSRADLAARSRSEVQGDAANGAPADNAEGPTATSAPAHARDEAGTGAPVHAHHEMMASAEAAAGRDSPPAAREDALGSAPISARPEKVDRDAVTSARADVPGSVPISAGLHPYGDVATRAHAEMRAHAAINARATAHGEVAVTARADTRQPRTQSTCPYHRERSTKGTVVCRSC